MTDNGRLKVGVVGAGIAHSVDGRDNFAVRAHLPALKALDETFEVAAVCTTRMESAREAATRFEVPNAFDSVDRMLEEMPELDIVCVSVKPAAHYDVAMAALHAGKHVYCEHPGSVSTQKARDMAELAAKGDLRTMTGHQGHFDPAVLHMAELIRSGYIGAPLSFGMTHFGANYITPRPYFHRWLFDSAAGGRPAYRTGHCLEHIMAVLDQDVTSLCADFTIKVPHRPAIDRPGVMLTSDQVDNMNYLLRLGTNTVGTLQVSNTAWSGTGDNLQVYGTRGMLMLADHGAVTHMAGDVEVDADDDAPRDFILYGAQADVEEIVREKRPPEELEHFRRIPIPSRQHDVEVKGRPPQRLIPAWLEFAAAIREGRNCSPSLHDTYKIHCIWDAAEESALTRRWVDVTY